MRAEDFPEAPPPALRRVLQARSLVAPNARWWRLAGGRTSRVFLARNRATARVCKIVARGAGSPLFRVEARAELLSMAALSRVGLAPAPRGLIAHGTATCLVYDHATGQPASMPGPELAGLLHLLHTRPPGLGRGLRHRPLFLRSALDRAVGHLLSLDWRDADLRRAVRATRTMASPTPRIVHGDPVPANVVSGPDGACLIDWQCAHLGDPVRDIAIAASPAMHVAYGCAPPDHRTLTGFVDAYPCTATRMRYEAAKPALHLQMIGHCLWRLAHCGSGATEERDRAALQAETRALAACL